MMFNKNLIEYLIEYNYNKSHNKIKKGFVLIEICVAIFIFLILIIGIFSLVRNVREKTKIISAKAQISQLALILEQVKNDTGYYPGFLSHLLLESPPPLQEKGWNGPYLTQLPIDPWGSHYVYKVPPTTVFASPTFPRTPGAPEEYTANFSAINSPGKINVINYGVVSGSISLNGVEIISEGELKKHPLPQIIEKAVNLQMTNTIVLSMTGKPGTSLSFSIIVENMPTEKYFELISLGKDKEEGGTGYNKDIIWKSDTFPNFIE